MWGSALYYQAAGRVSYALLYHYNRIGTIMLVPALLACCRAMAETVAAIAQHDLLCRADSEREMAII